MLENFDSFCYLFRISIIHFNYYHMLVYVSTILLDSPVKSDDAWGSENESAAQDATGFQMIAESGDEDLAYHGVMRLYVDKEMSKIGDRYLYLKTFLHTLYLLALGELIVIGIYIKSLSKNKFLTQTI